MLILERRIDWWWKNWAFTNFRSLDIQYFHFLSMFMSMSIFWLQICTVFVNNMWSWLYVLLYVIWCLESDGEKISSLESSLLEIHDFNPYSTRNFYKSMRTYIFFRNLSSSCYPKKNICLVWYAFISLFDTWVIMLDLKG